jgi:hypothetical protein
VPRIAKHPRLLIIVLAAVAGVLSATGDVSASTNGQTPEARPCRMKRVCSSCCCAPTNTSRDVIATWTDRATASVSRCECRSNDSPAAPANDQEATRIVSPSDPMEDGGTIAHLDPPRLTVFSLRFNSPEIRPARLALYLRNARLLF